MMSDGHLKKYEVKASKHPLARLKKHYQGLDAFTRHKQMINNYFLYYPGSYEKLQQRDTSKDKNDFDIIRENHKFLWNSEDISEAEKSWDARLAKRYYDKLFKEYCIADLTYYEKNKVAMRWRIEKEVKNGKGQFICGEKHCEKDKGLESWEVNFTYQEHGEKKSALVKLRLCPGCSAKLNYHSYKKRVTKEKKQERKRHRKEKKKEKAKKKRREAGESSESSSSSEDEEKTIKKETEDPEYDHQAKEEAKRAEEAAAIWSKDPFAEKTQEEAMDEFLDDLLF